MCAILFTLFTFDCAADSFSVCHCPSFMVVVFGMTGQFLVRTTYQIGSRNEKKAND